jgi:hypothetical protein
VLLTWIFCLQALRSTFGEEVAKSIAVFKWLFSISAVLWANSVVARSVSAYAAVPYEMEALLDSQVLQMSLTMFWTAVGLTLVLAAHRKQMRNLWWLGAAILGLVILKLFFVDLAKIGTLPWGYCSCSLATRLHCLRALTLSLAGAHGRRASEHECFGSQSRRQQHLGTAWPGALGLPCSLLWR